MRHLILTSILSLSLLPLFSQGPGCPSITINSYQGQNLPAITLDCDSSCVQLSSDVFHIAQTNTYAVSSLPWSGMPYASNTGVPLAVDDRWSGVIGLPFNFCFFGNVFNQLVVSTNGAISFNTAYANSYHAWNFTAAQTIPNNSAAFRPNSIFGAMHDTDPGYGGSIRYGVQGSFPCRVFVMSFENIPHYDCHSKKTTQQIVLYEGTNVIEVYIQNKPGGCSWNGGRAAIGIQNAAGDVGYAPPGRNTGTWSASNEAWRFSPSGAPAYQITWHEGNITNPPIGTGPAVTACPTSQFSSFSALLTYTNCANETSQFWSSVDVNLSGPAQPVFTSNSPVCETQTLTFNGPTVAGAQYFWNGPNGWSSGLEDPSIPGATSAISGTYNLYVVVAGCTSSVASQQVTVVSASTTPTFSTNSPVCEGTALQLNGQPYAGATYVWSGPNGFSASTEDPSIGAATPAAAGTYNLFIVVNGCTSGTASQNVVVNPSPSVPNFSTNSPVCTGADITFDGPNIPGATYNWTGPSGWTASTEDPTRPTASLGMAGDYYLTVTANGCTSQAAMQTVVVNGPDVPSFSSSSPVCTGDTITFVANPVAGASYHWSGPLGWDPGNVDSSAILNATAVMTGDYSLYLVSNGCTSETVTTPIFVIPTIPPVFTYNPPLCEGDTIQLAAPLDTTAYYFWSGPLGWVDTVANPQIPNSTVAMTGTYNLYMVALGCTTDTAQQTITVNPIPAAPTISSNSPVCEGSALNLNGPTIAGASYNWTGPNGYSSTEEDSTRNPSTLSMAGTYQLSVIVAGCVSPTSSMNVVVNDKPDVAPDVSPLTPCQNDQQVSFDANVTLQAPSVVIASGWDVDGNLVPDYSGSTATHTYATAGNYNAIFAVVSTGNCTTTVTVPIVVNPKPTVSYSGPTDRCGTDVLLTANGQVPAPASMDTYEWFLTGGTSIGTAQNLPHTFNANPFQQVTGYVVGTTSDGCSDTSLFSINLQPSPLADFEIDPCIGLTIPFDNTTTWIGTPAPGATLSYNWQFGDGQSGTTFEPTHTYPEPGAYTVTLTATSSAFGCADTLVTEIEVSTNPEVVINATPQCFQNVVFELGINDQGSQIQTISWNLDDGTTSSDSSFIHQYELAGTYTVSVQVTNAEECSTVTVLPVVVLPSPTLDQIEIPNALTPNGDAVNDELLLDTQFESCQEYEMFIFNRWGATVYKQTKGSLPFRGYTQDGKKRLTAGVYFFTIKSGDLERNGTISIFY